MTDCTKLSVFDVILSVADDGKGALGRVSAMYNSLPGMWLME